MSCFSVSLLRRYVRAVFAASLFPIVRNMKNAMPPTNSATIKTSTATIPAIIRIIFFVLIYNGSRFLNGVRAQSATKVGPREIVDDRRIEQQAIDPIENAAVPRQDFRCVFRARAAFQRALSQIAKHADDIHYRCEG